MIQRRMSVSCYRRGSQRVAATEPTQGWPVCDYTSNTGVFPPHPSLLDKGQQRRQGRQPSPALRSFGLQLDPSQNSQAPPSSSLVPVSYQPLQAGWPGLHPASRNKASGILCPVCDDAQDSNPCPALHPRVQAPRLSTHLHPHV